MLLKNRVAVVTGGKAVSERPSCPNWPDRVQKLLSIMFPVRIRPKT
jgi:hypothetical protein